MSQFFLFIKLILLSMNMIALLHQVIFINEDKICGFSFKNNKAHLYADSNDYARIMAPINRDLKAQWQ